ncbi:hypothetical protein RQP46_003578 [Phenoliferia psychrophenolica]
MSGEREGNWTPTLGGHGFKGSVDRACTGELLTQVFPSMLLSLCGACLTGMVLKHMQTWRVFVRIEELFILVPILLNLKDNIATPMASTLGDLVTLTLLGLLSTLFSKFMGTIISSIVFLALIAAVFFNYLLARRNAFVKELLGIGWSPLFLAMVISSVSGLILKHNINRFDGFALLTPVVTTLSGNAGTIFVSRISTSLHAATKDDHRALAARLFGLTTPIILGFLVVISATDQVAITPTFALAFVGAVSLALLLGYCITLLLWRWDYDPDVYALPLLASALDFSGQLMVWAAFAVAQRASMFADLRDVGGLQPR